MNELVQAFEFVTFSSFFYRSVSLQTKKKIYIYKQDISISGTPSYSCNSYYTSGMLSGFLPFLVEQWIFMTQYYFEVQFVKAAIM